MNPPVLCDGQCRWPDDRGDGPDLRSAVCTAGPRWVGSSPSPGPFRAGCARLWSVTFSRLTESAHLVFTGAVSCAAFAKHGTSF